MKTRNIGQYAIALAILVVAVAVADVPASTLFAGLIVLGCPVTMLLMMGGMHGGHGSQEPTQKTDQRADHRRHDDEHHSHSTTR